MKFYKDANGMFWLGGQTIPSGCCSLHVNGSTISIVDMGTQNTVFSGVIADYQKENGTSYASLDELKTAMCGFFCKASQSGGDWIPFTPTITATTTNPTAGTGSFFKCHYQISGKNLKIRFLFVGTQVGYNSGSGNYKINISTIPVTIDTSQLVVDGTGYADSQVGMGSITNNTTTYNGIVKINVLSSNELGVWLHRIWDDLGAAGFWSSSSHAINSKLSFNAEIPIL